MGKLLLFSLACRLAVACADKRQGKDLQTVSHNDWHTALAKVPEILAKIEPQYRERCERVLRAEGRMGFAQAWQDWILYRNFFAGQTQGLYIDIGTNEPIHISNTVFFDKCLGWDGVCFEPQSVYHNAIRRSRSCTLIPKCVLGKAKTVTISKSGGDFRVVSVNSKRRLGTMTCVGILDVLRELKLAGRSVDLLSIDIEGAEPSVLGCMPWAELDVRVVLIETNKHLSRFHRVDNFFHNNGFANVATVINNGSYLDNIYVRMRGGGLVVPKPWASARQHCDAADYEQNKWCHGHTAWPHNRVSSDWTKSCSD